MIIKVLKYIFSGAHTLSANAGNTRITSVECSHCGNMAWLGSEDGSVHEFNLQSGKIRKTFSMNPKDPKSKAHDDVVTGIGCQMLQVALITGRVEF